MNTDKTYSCACDFITNSEAIPIEFWFSLGNIKEYKCSYCNSIYKSQLKLRKLTKQQFWIYYLPCLYWFLKIIGYLLQFCFCFGLFFSSFINLNSLGFAVLISFVYGYIVDFIIFRELIPIIDQSHINKMYKDRINLCVKAFSKS